MTTVEHDENYRALFASPYMVQKLLEHFVDEPFVAQCDFTAMTREDTSNVTRELDRREGDMLWRIPHEHGAVYLCLCLEFQSTMDLRMPLRIFEYVALLYNRLAREDPLILRRRALPPVFSLVLYNGSRPWMASTDVKSLIQRGDFDGTLDEYQPQIRYHVVDERRLTAAMLRAQLDPVGLMFELESAQDPHTIEELVNLLIQVLEDEGQLTELGRHFGMWLSQVLPGKETIFQDTQIDSILEVKDMLAENMRIWEENFKREHREKGLREGREEGRVQGLEQGLEQGLAEGARVALSMLLEQKFGASKSRVTVLERYTFAQLQALISGVLQAQTEEALFNSVAHTE